jgi:peptidoglycan/xylan/chitin deacetylase (PgdA/CDA1 family)
MEVFNMKYKRFIRGLCFALFITSLFTACNAKEKSSMKSNILSEKSESVDDKSLGSSNQNQGEQIDQSDKVDETIVSNQSKSNDGTTSLKTYIPNETNVRTIGRTYYDNDILWLALSGTGAEFTFTGKKAVITIGGDNIVTKINNDTNYARIAIYVDGERVIDDTIDKFEKTYTILDSEVEQTSLIQIIKLSETAMSTVGVKQIAIGLEDSIEPTKGNEYRIEFIGDSITCGYGVDDEDKDHHFSTKTEDVTKSYAYKTAKALNADYSMFSISGYGIISGYTNEEKKSEQTIPQYYDKLGFSYGNFAGKIKVSSLDWDFNKYVPDLIVINLGTNDDSYCQNDPKKQGEYIAGYKEFLKQVRLKNPSAQILCTLGIMGDRLYPSLEKAVTEYMEETSDTKVSTMKFDVQNPEDGYAADWHPSDKTHTKAAKKLTTEIKKIMGWKSERNENTDISWINPDKPMLALTFDDGPIGDYKNSNSDRILNVLEKYGVHSTFFYVGNKINDSNKSEIERAFNLGCEIGNHTYTHSDLTKLSNDEILTEVHVTNNLLYEITGLNNFVVRPPFGSLNSTVKELINAPLITWSIDSGDWHGDYDSMTKIIKEQARDGAIILMHETYDHTAKAVEDLIPYFVEQGYQIVSVSELFAMKGVELQPGEVYSLIE